MIDYHKAEKALDYLAQTEQEWAEYKALLKYQSERHKACLARLSSKFEHTATQAGNKLSEALLKRLAESDKEYEQMLTDSESIAAQFYTLDAKRKRAEYTIEVWRSLNSAQKRGNV